MAQGVQPGDAVVTMLHNTVENYAIWFGIAWAGCTEVPINVDLRGNVLTHQLNMARPLLVIADTSAVGNIAVAAPDVPTLRRVVDMTTEESAPDTGSLERIAVADFLDRRAR